MSRECKYTVSGYCGLAIPCQGRCMLAPPPKESNSEALRLLREARPYTVGYDTDLPKRIDALLARAGKDNAGEQENKAGSASDGAGFKATDSGPGLQAPDSVSRRLPNNPAPAAPLAPAEHRPATLAEALSVTLARLHDQMSPAERRELREAIAMANSNAAPQALPVSRDATPLGGVASDGDASEPAVAAPAEAPTPLTDALLHERQCAERKSDVWDVEDVEAFLKHSCRLERDWLEACDENAQLRESLTAALSRERLANMRADQAEEAREAAQRVANIETTQAAYWKDKAAAVAIERNNLQAAQSATQRSDIPVELYDGMAVYVEVSADGRASDVKPRHVSEVLDAVVRLIRRRRVASSSAKEGKDG